MTEHTHATTARALGARWSSSTLAGTARHAGDAVRRTHSLLVEMSVLALAFFVWQVLRIPLEGSRDESLAHARDWLAAERSLHVDVEPSVSRLVRDHEALRELADLAYGNLHVPVVVGLLALVCVRAPSRYPKLRTTFVLAHVPALLVIAAFPLAPPRWLGSMATSTGPTADLRNETAAAVSMHFGYALLVACTAIWLWPRTRVAWAALLYPALLFTVILGTGHHYVLDTFVGAGCIAVGAAGAHLTHGTSRPDQRATGSRQRAAAIALAAALLGLLANGIATGGF
jgi:hypothetical protein